MALKQTDTSIMIAIIVSTLGTGILAMASSFSLLGYFYAFISLMISVFCLFFSLYSLAYSALQVDLQNDCTYSNLGFLFSRKLKHFIDIALLGSNYSTVVFLSMKFISFCTTLISSISYISLSVDTIRIIVLVLFVLTTFIFFIKEDVSALSFIPKISFVCVIYYILLTAFYALTYGQKISELTVKRSDKLLDGFINFVFALHCQFFFLNIFENMADKSISNIKKVLGIASISTGIIYGLSGFLGYKAVGNEIGKKITLEIFMDSTSSLMKNVRNNSFDKHGLLPILCVTGFLFIWFGSVVFASFQNINILQNWVKMAIGKNISRISIAIFYSFSIFVFGIIKNLEIKSLLDFCAALFTNPLSFVFPSLFLIFVTKKTSITKIVAQVLLSFSIFITIKMIFDKLK